MSDAVAERTLVYASATPPALRLGQGERARVRVSVENRASVVDQFALLVEGIGSEFFDVPVDQVSLFPGQIGELQLDVHLPSDHLVAAGVRQIVLRIASRHDASVEARVRLPLEIKLVRRVDLSLRPEQVRTRSKGRFRASLTNDGNSELVLDLAVSDPQEGLRAFLERDRLAVAPAETREFEIRLEPRHRPIQGFPTYHRFVVTATDADDPTQDVLSANGVLVYQPPLGWLGRILAQARAVAVVLLLLLLAAAIMVWILGAPGQRQESPPASTQAASVPGAEAQPQAAPEGSATGAGGTGAPSGSSGTGALGVAAGTNGQAAGSAPGAAPAGASTPVLGANPLAEPTEPAPTATPGEQAPVIMTFEVSAPPPDSPPGLIQLTWDVRNVAQVTIGGATLPSSGTALVQGLQQGEVELVARNSAGEARRSVGILVLQPPEITQFAATPPTGAAQAVTLTWQVARAESALLFGPDLDPNGVTVDPTQGSLQVRPTQNATYTLRATNALGRVEESLPVAASAPGGPASGTPAPTPSTVATPGTGGA